MVGQDGMIRLANPMATTMTGFSEQELMSKPFPLFVHQDDRVMLLGHHERRLRGEAVPARYVFRMIAKDGSTKWLEMSGVSIEWEGRPATLNFMTDVTERKKAEMELYGSLLDLTKARDSLELSEEKFRALANTTTDWVYWISPKGDFVFNSPSALKISGHGPEEFLSDPDLLIHVIHPDDRDRFQKHLTECTSPSTMAEPCEIEFRILKKDGGVRWISHTCGPIVDKNNQSLGRRASNRDITNRKRAEEELASALTRLKEAHHMAHIGAWDWLIENDAVIWSEELYRIAGMDPSLPAPTYAEHSLHYTPTSWEKLDCAVKSALTTGEPYNLELELVRPDGSIRWTNAIGGVKRDERGKIIGLHGILQDITERKKAEEALRLKNLVFDASIAANSIADVNGIITEANDAFLRTWKYTTFGEVLGRPISDFLKNESEAVAIITALNGVGEWKGEYTACRKDGSTFAAYGLATAIKDANGVIIGYQSATQDITDRKRSEHNANERMKELRAFFYLAEIVEREGITLEKLYQEFVKVLPESWQYPEVACARIVLGGEEFRTENYMDSAWKQSAPVNVNKAAKGILEICYLEERPEEDEGPFLKEERQLINAIAERLGHIINLKLAELELTNETIVATESRQKAEAYFDFLAHDIANILSPMVAYADMLKARPNNPEQVTKFSSKILEQGKRASSLISNLRRLESIERTHPNEIDTIDLRTLFSSLEDEIQSGFPDKEVALSYDIPDVPSMTVKGGEWVENVLRCVYDNAVRYSTGSAVELEISASMLQEESGEPFWQIEVSDHGPGIPDNIKSHFGESLTVVSDREFKGVASSLPFCVSMIKCLGGELLVQDRIPGDHKQGTRITIRLPRSE
jgi:PAS domain S-box-containing protein